MKPETKNCQNCKNDFVIEVDDFSFYEKIKVPPPTFCPECRMQRRVSFRNERTFYKRRCSFCDKNMMSIYPENTLFPVYCQDCWISDEWAGGELKQDFDFSKPFFEQYLNLFNQAPKPAMIIYSVNTKVDYANYVADSKNIYLSGSILDSENIFYSYSVDESFDNIDCCFSTKIELCYENIDCKQNNSSAFMYKSKECINSLFLFDCVNCQDCFMSSNIRNSRFVFRNKQMRQKEYEEAIISENLSSFFSLKKLKEEYLKLIKSSIHKFADIINSENSSGNNILNCKNNKVAFNVYNNENCKYVTRVFRSKDSLDIYGCTTGELIYEGVTPGFQSSKNSFCTFSDNLQGSFYTDWCKSSKHLFACIGLRNKSYCILNKQYTKEQYEELVPKIIQHMNDMPYIDSKGRVYKYGEFFPSELSPFAYNETIAQEYFPLTKEQALEQGYRWKDKEERNYTIDIKNQDIPDDIKDVNTDILGKVIECAHKDCNHQCTEAFKIIPEELQFYQRMNLPLPRLCPNCRHYERLNQRNPMKLWKRSCMKEGCDNTFETSYSPEREEIVYCEECYQKEVY